MLVGEACLTALKQTNPKKKHQKGKVHCGVSRKYKYEITWSIIFGKIKKCWEGCKLIKNKYFGLFCALCVLKIKLKNKDNREEV